VSLDDATLVARVLAGDASAYAGLVERYQDDVFRLAMRFVRRREDAEDLSQEAFVRAYRALAHYDPTRPFGAWMYAITSRLCIDFHRRRRLPTVSLTRPEQGSAAGDREWDLPSDDEGPEVAIERAEEASRLDVLINRLPADYRMAILLRHAHDLSYEEIAQATNAPIGTVKARIHRARMQLRAWLEGGEAAEAAPEEPAADQPRKKGGPAMHPGPEIRRKESR
jgi:RNA polymerase sigma-70 factor (ECF subfamily)